MMVQTSRLTLESLTSEQWAAVAEGRTINGAPDYPTEGDLVAAALVAAGDWPAGDWGPLQVRRIRDGRVIGGVGCKGEPDADGRVEIGYGLVPSARGRGYATEAVLGLLEWLRDAGVRQVVAECEEGNLASMAVLRRCFFTEASHVHATTWWTRGLSHE
ncbi:MAG: GNAT family N-acetyltransferase [Candidatus Nanopelagicales bacterium]